MSELHEAGKKSDSLKLVNPTPERVHHQAHESSDPQHVHIRDFFNHWQEELVAAMVTEKCQHTDLMAVFYTDGGCRPSRGIGGMGVHGYFYTDDVPKQGHGCKGFAPTPAGYVDSSKPDVQKVTVLKYVDLRGSLLPESTNNEAEVEALYEALCLAHRFDVKKLHLKLDSEYTLKGVQRIDGWIASNWIRSDGQPVANVRSWIKVNDMLIRLREKNVDISWQWVRGHSGKVEDTGNDMADKNATRGIVAGRKGMNLVDVSYHYPKGYWNPEIEYNRFLSEARWYFRTNMGHEHLTEDKKWTYHLGNHGSDDELVGKRISDTNYAVVMLSEPDVVLEAIREHQSKLNPALFNQVVVGRLDTILNPKVYQEIQRNDCFYVQRLGHKLDLYTSEELPLTRELHPPRLAFRAIESFVQLETVLNHVRNAESPAPYVLTDITDILYETDSSKKKPVRKLKGHIDSSTTTLQVDVKYNLTGEEEKSVPLTLTVAIDTPKRNMLAAIAEHEPKVFVVTWAESSTAFRYATIVRTERDIGIWAGVYANLRIVAP